MCDKGLETHVGFCAELELQASWLTHLQRALDSGFEVPTQRPRAVVGEKLEHVRADSLGLVCCLGLDREE